jgi:hypothetical protein
MLLNIAMKCWGIAEPDPPEAVQYRFRESRPSESRRTSNVGDSVFPQDLRKISLSRRASATVTAPATFPRIAGVNYESSTSILGNPFSKSQLMAVAIEQRGAENLEFLDALNRLRETSAPEARWIQFNEMFAKWIPDDADPQVNLLASTRNAFAVAHAACAANHANAASIVGVGTAFDALLKTANGEVQRMLQTPMSELQKRLPRQSLELNAS